MKPIRIAGAACGRVYSVDFCDMVPDLEIRLVGRNDALVATTRADSNGGFKLPPVPKGMYTVVTEIGWKIGFIDMKDDMATTCRQPLFLYAGVPYCDPGSMSRKWDQKVCPDGPSRK